MNSIKTLQIIADNAKPFIASSAYQTIVDSIQELYSQSADPSTTLENFAKTISKTADNLKTNICSAYSTTSEWAKLHTDIENYCISINIYYNIKHK